MFRRLQTKLSVLYGALFGVMLTLVGAATYTAITRNAEHAVRDELQASGTVFDRILALRSQQLHDGASLLAHDYGFRSAVATQDLPTTRSALDNLRGRLALDKAFIVRLDGGVTGLDPAQIDDGVDGLWTALDNHDDASGVLMLGGQPYQAISAPILAPNLVGWVVFAVRLDRAELHGLERLSALPLRADLVERDAAGHWRLTERQGANPADARAIQQIAAAMSHAPSRLDLADGPAIAMVKPLTTLGGGHQAALLLHYPLAAALAPYRPILAAVAVLGAISTVLLLIGSGLLARSLTRPIAALDAAAHSLMRGEEAAVQVTGTDEVGRLADSFNRMAAEIRERERRITHLALHDAETDLLNRRALSGALETLVAAPAAGVVVAAAIGIERFNFVRGAIGYGPISQLLQALAARITADHPDLEPARLTTGILGLVFRAENAEAAEALLLALAARLEEPVRVGETSVDVGVKVGMAVHAKDDEAVADLFDRANIALDQARAGSAKLARFDPDAYGDPAANLSLMSEMLGAIQNGDLILYFQPKLDLREGRVTGAEALVRWRHPSRGMLPPDLFVGMAEETGHIAELTDWVLDQAMAAQRRLAAQGWDLMMSVNLSGRLVGELDYGRSAIARIAESGARICFEITETAVMERPDAALAMIAAYGEAGVPISIDDYGSGLSSLAYLKQIAAQELKIDKAFVLALARNQRDALLVKSTVDLAHALGLKVTAEGVEDAETLALLGVMGCDIAQGYHIARPMPLEALTAFLDQARAAAAPAPSSAARA